MPPRKKITAEAQRELAVAAGYVDPYPALGEAPIGTIEDRCEEPRCRWTLFVALDCAVYCVNEKCPKFRYDLRQDVPESTEEHDDERYE
jgi:hypothetical protein